MRKKVFITIAVWGEDYIANFVKYSLATQLAPGNIPALTSFCDVTYQIITTPIDKARLETQPLFKLLETFCTIEWRIIDELFPPTGDGGDKYFFLSALQNYSMHSAIGYDFLIFNYADFVWADTSMSNLIRDFGEETDAVLSYCMRVDNDQAIKVMQQAADADGIIAMAPRRAVDMALSCMHRETKLAFWDDAKFTVTPSAVFWPVGDEGIVITAYHQTILALRVRPQDPLYYNGILTTSLDGYYSAALAGNRRIVHATNSDKFFAVSLADEMSDSSIGGASRAVWGDYSREDSMRDLLRGKVSEGQRAFALEPIEIRRAHTDVAKWNNVKIQACNILEKFHRETPFDPDFYNEIYSGLITDFVTIPPHTHASISTARNMFFPFRVFRALLRRFITLLVRSGFANHTLLDRFLAYAYRKAPVIMTFAPEVMNQQRSIELLYQGEVEHIAAHLPSRIQPVKAKNMVVLEGKAAIYFDIGTLPERVMGEITHPNYLLRVLEGAEKALRKAVTMAPLFIEGHRALARNLWFQGRSKEALEQFQRAECQQKKLLETLGMKQDAAVILPANCAQVIGLMGHLDAFLKMKILNADKRPYHLVVSESEIVNKAFFAYWKPYLELVSPVVEGDEKYAIDMVYTADWNWAIPQNDDSVAHVHTAIARIQRQWAQEKRAPLLQLSDDHRALAEEFKSRSGMKKEDWFVCLHVRSSGYYNDKANTAQDFRNTPLEDYYLAIQSVVAAGGWVMRMGDPSMPPLKDIDMHHVIDYAHSAERSAVLDVALCATCELFVSSPSGLHTVAHAFGRPACYINFPIYAGFPWHPGEIFIPKLYYSLAHHRILSMEEILSSNLVHADHQHLLAKEGIALLRNTPDEIAETVMEALKSARYKQQGGKEGRAAFEELNKRYGRDISGQLGIYFARKHQHTLFPSHSRDADHAHTKIRHSHS